MKQKKWKADEMELAINLSATRFAYGFILVALAIYVIYEFVSTGTLPWIPFVILTGAQLIFFGMKLYLAKRMPQ